MLLAFEIVLLIIMFICIIYMVEEMDRRKQENFGVVCIMAMIFFVVSVVWL